MSVIHGVRRILRAPRWRLGCRIAAVAILAVAVAYAPAAYASHPEQSLPGSDFEIDTDANLKVDDAAPSIDWANVAEVRKADSPSGANDESFGQGTKEDTAAPTVVDGSIPPNKSDLKFFGVYQEGNTSTGFLNLFWSRVQDPSGTTNMDFEFNKRQCTPGQTPADPDCAANGITPIRSVGDLLVIYDLSRGGTVPTLSIREWDGSAWGPATDLTASAAAAGSINTSSIPAADSDGLGAHDPRTFGEAQIALSAILDPTRCESFGSAYLKSRASDSFTAALKDFVPPQAVNITNCGRVVVEKVDEGGARLDGAEFTIDPANSATPPSSDLVEVADGLFCIDFLLIGTEYTVHESVVPPGFDPAPDQTFTPTSVGNCGDVTGGTPPDLTFVNVPQRGAVAITKTAKHADTSGATSPNLVAEFTITGPSGPVVVNTNADGVACADGLLFGEYTVTETGAPDGYAAPDPETVTVNNKATCSDDPYVGESVSMVNTPLTDITVSVDSQVPGGTNSVITCDGEEFTTDSNGDGSLTLEDLPPGEYNCTIVVDP